MSLDPALKIFIDETRRQFAEVKSDLRDVKRGMDTLYKFRWQIVGGSILMSVIFNAGIGIATMLVAYLK